MAARRRHSSEYPYQNREEHGIAKNRSEDEDLRVRRYVVGDQKRLPERTRKHESRKAVGAAVVSASQSDVAPFHVSRTERKEHAQVAQRGVPSKICHGPGKKRLFRTALYVTVFFKQICSRAGSELLSGTSS